MHPTTHRFWIALLLPLFLVACQKEEAPEPLKADPEVTLVLEHTFADQVLALHQPYLVGEDLRVELTKLQYYVSNIRLKRKDGTWWKQNESYHLVTVPESGETTYTIDIGEVPAGEYTEMAFGVGVDEFRNHQGEQTGALDPLNGMLWTWESGYVFFKMEGFYEHAQNRHALIMHVGRDDCYREVTLPLPAANQTFRAGDEIKATLMADISRVFGGQAGAAYTLRPPEKGGAITIMGNPGAQLLSQNYATMFSLKEVVATEK